MERPDLEESRAANYRMKRLVDSMLDGLDRQRADLPGACERLAVSRSSAWSSDQLVEVTVDAYGIVVEVELSAKAFETSTPQRLARSITEAARTAAELAQQQRAQIIAPIIETTEGLLDLPDLFPGAPSLREIRDIVGAAAQTDVAADHEDRERERES